MNYYVKRENKQGRDVIFVAQSTFIRMKIVILFNGPSLNFIKDNEKVR